ncbi:MAG TPA: DUF1685 domain-containing protein [Anaerolineae bacterium]|nr:DUF1685 domain-containing protein [Anaerolineae bacterium]
MWCTAGHRGYRRRATPPDRGSQPPEFGAGGHGLGVPSAFDVKTDSRLCVSLPANELCCALERNTQHVVKSAHQTGASMGKR